MKELSIKTLIRFRGLKSESSKKNFVYRLKQNEGEVEEEENYDDDKKTGGNYWSSGLGAIHTTYKSEDTRVLKNRIAALAAKYRVERRKQTRDMHKRNIDIMTEFENVNFKEWKPTGMMEYLKTHTEDYIITIKGLKIKAKPDYVFSFKEGGVRKVGAIWFIADIKGFRNGELGMYAELLNQYLKTHHSDGHIVDPEFCIALDVVRKVDVSYAQVKSGQVPKLLMQTINEINQFM
jgi:hypothetical protein